MKNKRTRAKVQNRSKKINSIEELAYIINSTGGSEASMEAKKIIHSYASGEIDYETAKQAILETIQK